MTALLAVMVLFMLYACRHVHIRTNWHADELEAEANIAAWRESGAVSVALMLAIACALCIVVALSVWAAK